MIILFVVVCVFVAIWFAWLFCFVCFTSCFLCIWFNAVVGCLSFCLACDYVSLRVCVCCYVFCLVALSASFF